MPAEPPASGPYWSQPADALLSALDARPEGLSTREAGQRLERFGPNALTVRKRLSPVGLFLNQFRSPIILILLFATILSAILSDYVDSVIIIVIVLVSAILSFVQEYSASTASERLRSQVTIRANVWRDGESRSIPAEEIVPGDVVALSAGSLIPADGVLLEAKDFFVNQAVLTGETFPVEKKLGVVDAKAALAARTNCVFMGTNVRSGSARALIVQTGGRTEFGKIAKRLTLRPPMTEFERGIRRLGYLLTEVMLFLVLAVFAVNVFFNKPVLDSLLFSVALAVGLTPDLLPAIININLSKGSQDMASGGVIVRRLSSIENIGSMDVLCTDKTGTLTEGIVQLDGALDSAGQPSDEVLRYAFLNASLQTGLANPLDEAIIAAGKDGLDVSSYTKVDEIPYDFIRKRLSVVVEHQGKRLFISKGAVSHVLEACSQIRDGEGAAPLDRERRARLEKQFDEWSGQGFRVLGLAIREVGEQPTYTRADEHDLTFAGFLLFFDPPKPGVKETIQDLAGLGVEIKIITGDNKLVALHTADSIGLEVKGVLSGSQLDELGEEALWHAAQNTTLFVEVDPNQKERIILALEKTEHVVGFMGDGINDAPALHAADVGISVDQAVDVAKDAADLVLLQKDLAVLHRGIVEGRRTFANTLKYVFMATSANFGNMFSMAGASLFLPFLPMLPKQILLINFMTDLPEMTIAGDNVDPDFIQRPHRWNIGFIRRFMIVFGPLSSVFDFLTFGILLLVLQAGQAQFHTGWFVESVLSATVVVFALRTRFPFIRSRPSRAMMAVTAAIAAVTLALPYLPYASLLGFEPLPAYFLLAMAGITLLYFIAAEIVKRWFYRHAVA